MKEFNLMFVFTPKTFFFILLVLIASCSSEKDEVRPDEPSNERAIDLIQEKYMGIPDSIYLIKISERKLLPAEMYCKKPVLIKWEAFAKEKLLKAPNSGFGTFRAMGKTYYQLPTNITLNTIQDNLNRLRSVANTNLGIPGKNCELIGSALLKADTDCKKWQGDSYADCVKSRACSSQEHVEEYMELMEKELRAKYSLFTEEIDIGDKAFGTEDTFCLF